MLFCLSSHDILIEIGIAIDTMMTTSIIFTNVYTFNAAAFLTLILVLSYFQRTTYDFGNQNRVYASTMFYTRFQQVDFLAVFQTRL